MKIGKVVVATTALMVSLTFLSGFCMFKPKFEVVKNFELEKYLGTWHEIARLNHWFEKGCVEGTATYSRWKKPGQILVDNACIRNGKLDRMLGKAWLAHKKSPHEGALRVSFFPPFHAAYNIIALDKDYKYVMVAGHSKKYLWILAREPMLDSKTISMLIKKAEMMGFDTSKLVMQGGNKRM